MLPTRALVWFKRDLRVHARAPLLVRIGSVVPVLAQLHQERGFTHVLSHEETGPGWSYTRDKAAARWSQGRNIPWAEFTQTGVVRRLRRSRWA